MSRYYDIDPSDIDPETGRPYSNYSSDSLDTSFHDGEMGVDDEYDGDEPDDGWNEIGVFKVESDFEEYGCGHYTQHIICTVPKAATDQEVGEWVRSCYPSTRCHHEHDCCGHYYASTATWSPTQFKDNGTRTILVRQSWSQNV